MNFFFFFFLKDELKIFTWWQQEKKRLLEGTFDWRGCNFKVLVSPGVHPLICGDSQSCDLNKGEKKQSQSTSRKSERRPSCLKSKPGRADTWWAPPPTWSERHCWGTSTTSTASRRRSGSGRARIHPWCNWWSSGSSSLGGGRQKGAPKGVREKRRHERTKEERTSLLTADAAVHHPADHAEQEEQVTHEVAMIAASWEKIFNRNVQKYAGHI